MITYSCFEKILENVGLELGTSDSKETKNIEKHNLLLLFVIIIIRLT